MAETAGRGVFVNANQPSIAKFTRPTLTEVYARPRLFKLLDRALGRAVVWISGAPGAGKGTQAVMLADEIIETQPRRLGLDRFHNLPTRQSVGRPSDLQSWGGNPDMIFDTV